MNKKLYVDIDIVKNIMKEKAIDIKTMASLMKVTPTTVRRYLNGADQSNMRLNVVFKIARALNVSIPVIIHKDYH